MKLFFNTLSVIMLVLLVICAVLYFVKGLGCQKVMNL